jgi:xanthine dehydrogenase accessory factor
VTAMNGPSITQRAQALRASRLPFVHARVVLAEKPTSSKPGDQALVLDDGTIEGFVGGSCAASTVREQSLKTLATGESLLLRITPEPEDDDQPGKLVVHNHCLSGGTLEIFLEPELPSTLVAVVGTSPIAEALVRLGNHAGFEAVTTDGDIPTGAAAVVVAAHGHGDEARVLGDAIAAGVGYIGLIASPRRGAAVVAALELGDDEAARIHTPAGFDIGARTPEEIALSILAEIVAERPRAADPAASSPAVEARADVDEHDGDAFAGTSIDPVCSMTVQRSPQGLYLEHHDGLVFFCGLGCKQAFAADPAAYPLATTGSV